MQLIHMIEQLLCIIVSCNYVVQAVQQSCANNAFTFKAEIYVATYIHSFQYMFIAGLAYRRCLSNAEWDEVVNVSQCYTIELIPLNDRMNELQEIFNANMDNYTIDLSDIMEMQAMSEELVMTTDTSSRPILPSDLNTTNNILNTIIE